MIWRALCSAITEGMSKLRAKMAVWLVGPPTSVTNAATRLSLKKMVSAGEMSWAIKMVSSNKSLFTFNSISWPRRFLKMRSPTCNMSCLRSRKYSSSITSNCCDKRSNCTCSAHSALISFSSMMSMGSRDKVTSVNSIKCNEINAPNSVGAFSGMLLRNCSNCRRVNLTAV